MPDKHRTVLPNPQMGDAEAEHWEALGALLTVRGRESTEQTAGSTRTDVVTALTSAGVPPSPGFYRRKPSTSQKRPSTSR